MNKLTVFCAVACLTTSAAAQNYPDLYEILDRQKGQSLIEIPKGTYTLDVRNNGPYKFHNLTDVHINGNGSTVICNNQEQAFSFYNCVRVELRDLTIDYDPLCFTQGEITAVAEDGSWFDVRIDKGYPVTGLAANRVQFYDPQTRLLKRNSITTYTSNYSELKQLGHNLFRAVKNGTWSAGEQVGDLVVMDVKTDKPNAGVHTIMLNKCYNTKLETLRYTDPIPFLSSRKKVTPTNTRTASSIAAPCHRASHPACVQATQTASTAVRPEKARPSRGARWAITATTVSSSADAHSRSDRRMPQRGRSTW